MSLKRFSHIYIDRPKDQKDSQKIRKRISSYYSDEIYSKSYDIQSSSKSYRDLIKSIIEKELGIEVPYNGGAYGYYDIAGLIKDCDITDFLDVISAINHAFKQTYNGKSSQKFIEFVEKVFREEQAKYTIDEEGTVHLHIDAEFQLEKIATVQKLDGSKYGQVRAIYENAYAAVDKNPPDTRTAIKDIFESLETLTKLIDTKITRLTANEVNSLKKICDSAIDDEDEKDFIKQMLSGFADWVNAHQIYRHGQGKEEHTPPSLEAAIFSLSTGTTYLRYLIGIHTKII